MKLDILAIGAHPDDVELGAAGTIISHIQKGYKCGIIDLSRGELGTRGNAEKRIKEANHAAEIMGILVRENLEMEDGFFQNDKKNQLMLASMIRKYKPEIILSNAVSDRHPDHGRGAELVSSAIFIAGLIKVKTDNNLPQEPWRVKAHYNYIQDRYIKPDIIIDISEFWEKKMETVKAFKTQFYDPSSSEPDTPISGKDFLNFLAARAIEFGRSMGVQYAEGFTCCRTPGVKDLFDLY